MTFRVRCALCHLLVSGVFALLTALLVFVYWYPPPYARLVQGLELFALLVFVDLVVGPVLTAVVANPHKGRRGLQRDIGVIAVLQLLAFGYGMQALAIARPVHLVFEVDRFRVVVAADVDESKLSKALPDYRQLPWLGPTLVVARKSATSEEMTQALNLSLQGVEISMLPERWAEYEPFADAVLKSARPAALLIEQYPEFAATVQSAAQSHGLALEDVRFLPVVSRKSDAVALVGGPKAAVLGFIPVDGFFTPVKKQ